MKETALRYKRYILDNGIDIIEDPFEQLYMIIKKVLESWESAKAITYRKIMGISNDWGTAVTVPGNGLRQHFTVFRKRCLFYP